MKIDLSATVKSLEGHDLNRKHIAESYSADAPLTLAFVVAHVISVAVEDLNAADAEIAKAAASEAAGQPPTMDVAASLARSVAQKVARGALALRIAQADPSAVDLSPEELVVIKSVAAPRLMPLILTQLFAVIN